MGLSQQRALGSAARWLRARARGVAWVILPLILLLVALGLRLYGLDWDQGRLYHPDERAILMKVGELRFPAASEVGTLLDADESPLNPRWFPYGSLPMYLVEVLTVPFSPLADWDIFQLRLLGRVLSTLADLGTVLLVYLLGARFFGRRVGLLAGLLTSLAVIHIQLSHFYTVDTFLTFFIVGAVYFTARVAQGGGLRHSLAAGAFLGLALASKISVLPLLLPLVLAHAMAVTYGGYGRYHWRRVSWERWRRALLGVAVGAGAALVMFFVTTPYAFLDWRTYLGDVLFQGQMVRRAVDLPYTRQYIDTAPYWYHIRQLAVWGLGPPLGILAWLALPVTAILTAARRRPVDLLILSWVVPYFLIFGFLDVKFLRYMLPITPFLLLMVARLFFGLRDALAEPRPRWARGVEVGMGLVVVATGLYALAYLGIYTQDHSANRARSWMEDNVPPGSVVLREHWEESLPDLYGYQVQEIPLYEPDGSAKLDLMARQLAGADYIVFYSNRLYGTIPRLPERYPMTGQYYELLFSGELGFELAHYETSYPRLPGVALVDDTFSRPGLPVPEPLQGFLPQPLTLSLGYADESFTVYDHPKVMVFQKVRPLTYATYLELLGGYSPAPEPGLGLMMSPEMAQLQQAGGTWSRLFNPDGLVNRVPVLFWLLFIEIIALVTLPLAVVLFRSLPDRGFLLAKGLGLLLVAWLVWLLASLQWLPFSSLSILVGVVVVAGASLLVLRSQGPAIREALRDRGRVILIGEALFLAAFLSFYLLRLANPDLWHPYRGGEKPMDFAYLNAVVRSTFMPPYDPWFAGGHLNYYYFGQFIVATIIKGTGILPAVAYNLAVPLLFALTVAMAFSLVYNLTASVRQRGGALAWPPLAAGLLAALFVVVLGNLDGAAQLVQGAWRVLVQDQSFPTFDFWRSSRMMPEPPGVAAVGHEITEFPFFTFLFADLHAHLMAIPFDLLALGLGLALVLGRREGRGWWTTASLVGLLALTVGALRAINTWDYPTFLALAMALVFIGEHARSGRLTWGVVARGAAMSGVLFGLSYLLMLPYHLSFEAFYSSVTLSRWQTRLWQYAAIHGLFLFLVVSYLVYVGRHRLRTLFRSALPQGVAAEGAVVQSRRKGLALGVVVGALAIGLAALALVGYVTVAVLVVLAGAVLMLGVAHLARPRADTSESLVLLAMLGAALGLGVLVDVVTMEGDIDRMNTVFKFYLQAWVLWGLVSAYVLARMGIPGRRLRGPWPRTGRVLWAAALALLLLASVIYPVLGTRERLRDRFQLLPLTGDGTAFMAQAVYHDPSGAIQLQWDREAIGWLQEHVEGSPVIMEGRTPLYRWGSRISIYTGLPTVLGWDWHQRQQRWGYQWAVDERARDVEVFYSTPSTQRAAALLEKYGVGYVVVGQVERLYYPEKGIAKFQQMEGASLELVYRNPETRIYRVVRG